MIRSRHLLFLFPLFLPPVASAQQFGATNAQVITQAIEFFEVRVANPDTAKTEAVQPLAIYNSADPGPAKKSPAFLSVSPLLSGADGGKLAMTATLRTQAASGVPPQQYQINVTDPHGNIVVAPTSFPGGNAGIAVSMNITIDPLLHPGPWKMGILSGDTLIHQIDVRDASGDCPSCGSASCRTEVNLGCAETTIPVGPVLCGLGRVSLTWFDSSINGTFPGRANLRLRAAPDGVVVHEANGVIDWVKVYPSLATTGTPAWIATVAGSGDRLIVTVTNGSTAEILRVVNISKSSNVVTIEERIAPNGNGTGGDLFTSTFTSNLATVSGVTTGVVTLSERNGLRSISDTISDDGCTRTENRIVSEKNASGQMTAVSAVRTIYHYFSWGREIVRENVLDSTGGFALTTVRNYSETPGAGFARLATLTRPDESTETHTYSGTAHTIVTPFAGQTTPLTKTITTSGNTRTEEDKVGGMTLAKTVTSFGESNSTRTVFASTTDTLVTVTSYGTREAGSIAGGRPVREDRPDGTAVVHQYELTGSGLKHTVLDGQITGTTLASGTKVEEVRNAAGELFTRLATRTQASVTITTDERMAVSTSADRFGRYAQYTLATSAGNVTLSYSYGCCGPLSDSDIHGVTTYRALDDLDRTRKVNRLGVTTETTYDGLSVITRRYAETYVAGTFPTSFSTATDNIISRQTRNLAGTSSTSESPDPSAVDGDGAGVPGALTGTTTATSHGGGITTTTVTVPDGTQTTVEYPDGRGASTFGTLRPGMEYTYTVNGTGLVTTSTYTGSVETTVTQTDWAGRTTDTAKGTITAHYTYDPATGQLQSVEDADHVLTLYGYNTLGERTTTAIDFNSDSAITYGTDQVTRTETIPLSTGVLRTATYVWKDRAGETAGTLVAYSDRTPDGLQSWGWRIGADNPTHTQATLGLGRTETTTRPDGSCTISTYAGGLLDTTTEGYVSGASIVPIFTSAVRDATNVAGSGYDPLKRPRDITDSRTGRTRTVYVSATCDAVASVIDPGGRTTSFTYDSRGNRLTVDAPDTDDGSGHGTFFDNLTSTSYNPDGTVLGVSGGQTYPVSYTYDYARRIKTMITSPNAEPATTKWIYAPDTGLLTAKRYDVTATSAGTGPSYGYTAAGRLKTRTWVRGVVTCYGYEHGLLTAVDYFGTVTGWNNYQDALDALDTLLEDPEASEAAITAAEEAVAAAYAEGIDTATPSVRYNYDAFTGADQNDHVPGTIETVTSAGLVWTYKYDGATLLPLSETHPVGGTSVTRVITRSFNAHARPGGFTLGTNDDLDSDHTVSYGYNNAGSVNVVTGAGKVFTYGYAYTQDTYAGAPRAGVDATATGAINDFKPYALAAPKHTVIRTYEGTRDALVSIDNKIGTSVSYYLYEVNNLGQRETLYTTGRAFSDLSPNHNWAWRYDALGQLTTATCGWDSTLSRTYTFDDIGNRLTATTDSGEEQTTTTYTPNRLNQYASISPSAMLPRQYDADGNLYTDAAVNAVGCGLKFKWDGENRLTAVCKDDEGSTLLASYAYDYLGRRIRKTTTAAAGAVSDTAYVYDGWNVVAEYAISGSSATLTQTYTWGLDLSGLLQGAGGVGGLLCIHRGPGTAINGDRTWNDAFYPTFDGNGNVSEYFDKDGTQAAHIEYDPFGRIVNSTGSPEDFTYRFATKPQDFETGIYYYGYRYYDPFTGRWPSRDPIGERGGKNLYGFVRNDGVAVQDYLGLSGSLPGDGPWGPSLARMVPEAPPPSPFLSARPRDGWISYSSIYEQADGKPLSDLDLWTLLWSRPGVFDKGHLDPKRIPPPGSPVVNNGVLKLWDHKAGETDIDSIVTVAAGVDCCLHGSVSIKVNYMVINVEALNHLFDDYFWAWVRQENYWGTVAHELSHIRSYSARVKAIVDDKNMHTGPCYKTWMEADKAAEVEEKELNDLLIIKANNLEAVHTQNDGFDTASDGIGRGWHGPGGPNP